MDKKTILFVDDDFLEHKKFERALKKSDNPELSIESFNDGSEALKWLESNKHAPPQLIILDLNMPLMNGLELLELVKQDHYLKRIPVVILTTSKNPKDIEQAHLLQAAGYIVKPNSNVQYQDTIQLITQYWMTSQSVA
ncbi:MAG: response regulator [Saprospiraceae bacterium]|nr:response regulator [Saprospiraceae bacterium]